MSNERKWVGLELPNGNKFLIDLDGNSIEAFANGSWSQVNAVRMTIGNKNQTVFNHRNELLPTPITQSLAGRHRI